MSAQLKQFESVNWVEVLRSETVGPGKSQSKAAKRLRVSTAMISKALSPEGYDGDVDKLKERVLGEFLGKTVMCPVLGVINKNDCITHQQKELQITSSQAVLLYRACHNSCPHSQVRKDKS